MLSKVLRRTHDSAVPVLEWNPSGRGAAAHSQADAQSQTTRAASQALDEATTRVAELERALFLGAKEAEQRGVEAGRAAARTEFNSDLRPLLDQLASDLADIAAFRDTVQRESEQDLATLAVAIARRILHREITLDTNALQGLVLSALRKLHGQRIIRLRVHPQFVPAVRESLGPEYSEVEVVPETRAGAHTVIFETERGNLDACIDSQLEEIRRGLVDGIPK